MNMEIIDFHTHPFDKRENNICQHIDFCNMSLENTKRDLNKMGITRICGSVICGHKEGDDLWEKVQKNNNEALRLKEIYGDFYVPGFHVHPAYIKESCEEIEKMHKLGVNLVGELVPYIDGWTDYSSPELSEILDLAGQYNMIVSFHNYNDDEADKMVAAHKNVTFVAAHPGEYSTLMRHIDRMKKNDNCYLDLAAVGIFRHGMLRRAIDEVGAERILFGTDYPTCSPSVFLGGVLLDHLITDKERELVLAGNAKRILGL